MKDEWVKTEDEIPEEKINVWVYFNGLVTEGYLVDQYSEYRWVVSCRGMPLSWIDYWHPIHKPSPPENLKE